MSAGNELEKEYDFTSITTLWNFLEYVIQFTHVKHTIQQCLLYSQIICELI